MIKRAGDLFVSLLLVIIFSPVLLAVTIILAFVNNGSVWFIQPRPGVHGRIFHIIKFRTMTNARDASGNLLSDDIRLTKTGKWVRRLSFDELPQLINVIKGDMSIVGPRPLLVEYLPLYNERQRRRHDVRPGITGWAQVNGRNTVTWEKKFEYDAWYADNISFLLDIRILILTVIKVLKAEGISSATSATMERFNGN